MLQVLPPGHGYGEFHTIHLDLLLVQMLLPNVRGLPLLDLTSANGSRAVYTYTKSGGNNWPHVLVEGKECCVLQLLWPHAVQYNSKTPSVAGCLGNHYLI